MQKKRAKGENLGSHWLGVNEHDTQVAPLSKYGMSAIRVI